ncbi:arginase family protein [Candidatus Woesearchaeota archaeon]|nr:MAG: arginase family protein [Candidatus Woesearchaeota archaeon]
MEIVKVPNSLGGLEKTGSESAPDLVIKYLTEEIWTNEFGNKLNFKVNEINVRNETDIKKVQSCISSSFKQNSIYVGGDHSITYSLFKPFVKLNPGAGIISFDAHPDVYQTFDYPTQGDWLYYLIEEGHLKPENVIIVGIRSSAKEEIEYLQKKGIKYYPMKNLLDNRQNVCDSVMELARSFPALYLSIDIDIVDPAFAPGTGYIEPAGLSSRELLYFIQRLKLLKNIKCADLVEINPGKDVNDMTSKLGAKILGELL